MGLRPDSLLMFEWVSLIGVSEYITIFRVFCEPYLKLIPEWMIYCAPNGLWMLSFTCFIVVIWGYSNRAQIILWSGILLLVALSTELLQLTPLISGVFDPLDIVSYIAGCLAGLTFVGKGNTLNE